MLIKGGIQVLSVKDLIEKLQEVENPENTSVAVEGCDCIGDARGVDLKFGHCEILIARDPISTSPISPISR